MHFGELLSIFLFAAVTLSLLATMFMQLSFSQLQPLQWRALAVASLMALALSIVPFIAKNSHGQMVYGPTPIWCFIRNEEMRFAWLLYAPLLATILISVVTLVVAKIHLHYRDLENQLFKGFAVNDPVVDRLPKIIMMYLVAIAFTWLPIVVAHMYTVAHPSKVSHIVPMVMVIAIPLRGFFDAAVGVYQAWMGGYLDDGERPAEHGMRESGIYWKKNRKNSHWVE